MKLPTYLTSRHGHGYIDLQFPSMHDGTISGLPQDEDDILRPLLSAAPPGRLLALLLLGANQAI
jgi:hypothetical protein